MGMDSPLSSAELWKPLALKVLAAAGKSSTKSDSGKHFSLEILNYA